jgi:cytoplasmic iron level regulating protein YaaA (DUF328/UPF0246 family)
MIPTRRQQLQAAIDAGELTKPRLLRSRTAITSSMSKLTPQQLELVRFDLVDWVDAQTENQVVAHEG